jgi:hypothetical protein
MGEAGDGEDWPRGRNLPAHGALGALGIDILDNQDLEAVAETAARLNRSEFLLTVAPIPVTGGTGFPVNALAIFQGLTRQDTQERAPADAQGAWNSMDALNRRSSFGVER